MVYEPRPKRCTAIDKMAAASDEMQKDVAPHDTIELDIEAFVSNHGFVRAERAMDPHIAEYFGTYIPSSMTPMLREKVGEFTGIVEIYVCDNSDIGVCNTVRVVIGVEQPRPNDTYGIFGRSSPWCISVAQAYNEAVCDFIYKRAIAKTGPGYVGGLCRRVT